MDNSLLESFFAAPAPTFPFLLLASLIFAALLILSALAISSTPIVVFCNPVVALATPDPLTVPMVVLVSAIWTFVALAPFF